MKFIIPTINSSSYILFLKKYLDNFEADYAFFVDEKTSDNTYEILKENSSKNNIFKYKNNNFFLENNLKEILKNFQNQFIFRLDCDEIPSPELIKNLKKLDSKDKIYAFPRYEVFKYREQFLISGPLNYFKKIGYRFHRQFFPKKRKKIFFENFSERRSFQYRYYYNFNLKFEETLHSPGIAFDRKKQSIRVEKKFGYLIHFNLILKTINERIKKLRTYDRIYRGGGYYNRFSYVPEFFIRKNFRYLNYFQKPPIFVKDYINSILINLKS